MSTEGAPPSTGSLTLLQIRPRSATATSYHNLKVAANSSDQGAADSGYASIRSTPIKEYAKTGGEQLNAARKQIKAFDKEISDPHRRRFSDLQELFCKDLHQHILKKLKGRQDYGTVAWRLKCLGETQDSACPWIIILCDEKISETVRKYFKRIHVKDQFRPSDESLVSFNVQVCAVPLTYLASPFVFCEHIYTDLAKLSTLCGTIVCNVNGSMASFATLGGVIKIKQNGESKFLGMTAGHIFNPQWLGLATDTSQAIPNESETLLVNRDNTPGRCETEEHGNDSSSEDSEEDEEDDDTDTEDLDEAGFDLDLEGLQDMSKASHLWEANHKLRQSADSYPSIIGLTQHHSSSAVSRTGCDLDWTLFGIERALPNVLKSDPQQDPLLCQVSDMKCTNVLVGTPVWILTSHGNTAGTLESSASILRAGAPSPIDTFIVQLTCGNSGAGLTDVKESAKTADSLRAGDSGSWVVTQDQHEVIGYVLASDVFRDVYVIPFRSALDDIKQVTGADSCGLFDMNDMLSYKTPMPKMSPKTQALPAREPPVSNTYYRARPEFYNIGDQFYHELTAYGLSPATVMYPGYVPRTPFGQSSSPTSAKFRRTGLDSGYASKLVSNSNSPSHFANLKEYVETQEEAIQQAFG